MSKAIAPGKLKLRKLYALLGKKSTWQDCLPIDEQVHQELSWLLNGLNS